MKRMETGSDEISSLPFALYYAWSMQVPFNF
jgi:hypothetical protein